MISLARPARLERATCGFVVNTSELPNLLKVKEVFETTSLPFFLLFLILARFIIFWKVFLTQIHTQISFLLLSFLSRRYLLTALGMHLQVHRKEEVLIHYFFHFHGSFNGKLTDELLNVEIFTTFFEAQVLIENWRKDYNQVRPHSALGLPTPCT